MLEVLILTILTMLGYIVIAGITAGILIALRDNNDDVQQAIESGIIWPLTIPILIVCGIGILINNIIEEK